MLGSDPQFRLEADNPAVLFLAERSRHSFATELCRYLFGCTLAVPFEYQTRQFECTFIHFDASLKTGRRARLGKASPTGWGSPEAAEFGIVDAWSERQL